MKRTAFYQRHRSVFSLQLNPLLLIFCITLFTACEDNDDNSPESNNNDGFFAGVQTQDFIDFQGQKTRSSERLARCSIINNNNRPCRLEELDFLARISNKPNKEQILDRLIVSDIWMAENFSQLLDRMPDDIYQLFSSTTAIVIHKNIRPAFFWAETGAIYLDPAFLWLTTEQLNSISQEPDFRQAFAERFKFVSLSLYSFNGEPAFGGNTERTKTQALHSLSALLFHELAHANDFFPRQTLLEADPLLTPVNIIQSQRLASDSLNKFYPLLDDIWHRLAAALFAGQEAESDLLQLSAEDVSRLFEVDSANDPYAYFISPGANPDWHFEDTAMLFEEVMMKLHYDINREIALATPLVEDVKFLNDLDINWSAINRFQDTQVLPRAQSVVDALLPDNPHADFFNALPSDDEKSYLTDDGGIQARKKENVLIPVQHRH